MQQLPQDILTGGADVASPPVCGPGQHPGDGHQITIRLGGGATWVSLCSDLRSDGGINLAVKSDGRCVALKAERNTGHERRNQRGPKATLKLDAVMLEELKADLDELKADLRKVEERLDRLHQPLLAPADTSRNRVQKTLDRLRLLIAAGKANANEFRRRTDWAEVEDLAEGLKGSPPDGLFRHINTRLQDSRRRLEQNPLDAHAVSQLEYVEKVLANAAKKTEKA